jgi:hypothetical protein
MSNELESDSAMMMNLERYGVDGAGYARARALAAPVVRCRWRWVALAVNPRGTGPGGAGSGNPPARPGGRGRRGGGGNRATVTHLPPCPRARGSDFRPPVGDSPPRHLLVLASITRRHDFERGASDCARKASLTSDGPGKSSSVSLRYTCMCAQHGKLAGSSASRRGAG